MAWRSFLAIALSLLVLVSWPIISKKVFNYQPATQEVTGKKASSIFTSSLPTSKDRAYEEPRETIITEQPEIEQPEERAEEPVKKPLKGMNKIMIDVLTFLHNILKNWGLAIVVLAVLVWFVFSPLTAKSTKAMMRMQALAPRVEEIRQQYKDTPQKANTEIMQLYREEKVNPLGGCLPLLLQIPVFWGLFGGLRNSDILNGANFLWIKDLSQPDRLFTIQGFPINILPLAMALVMFLQQKLTHPSGHSAGASASVKTDQQKMMTIIFPVMFGFMFYRFASGLVLYWFVNSLLMLVTQLKMAKSMQSTGQ